MTANYHTHTTFCDGKNTPEEIVLYAIDKGHSSIGFSGHGYTPFDVRYCMKDTDGYIREITGLKEKYAGKIQIYCGSEEDAFACVDRNRFDYIIGSSHYFCKAGVYYPIDSGYDYFKKCLALFDDDPLRLAETYYSTFTDYIIKRQPDIVGHFDVITKFDEIDAQYFLNNREYLKIAEKYIRKAAEADVVFELNTGAISRGVRTTPYLGEELLGIMKEENCRITISSDCHSIENLTFQFEEMEHLLRFVGFDCVYEMYDGAFRKKQI